MSSGKSPRTMRDEYAGFTSLGSLREAHNELMEQYRASEKGEVPANEIRQFIEKGRATGALLGFENERVSCQSILDYWMTFLFRIAGETPDATLHDLDENLAPELPDDACPYMGLDQFRTEDARYYFGQRKLVQQMVDHLRTNRLLVVTGPSGCGKSSAVLAGLIPRLQAQALSESASWRYPSPILPGPSPLRSFERTRERISDKPTAVIVVDQFEEVFTLCRDQATRQKFASAVVDMTAPEYGGHLVILTLRSDFEFHLAKLDALQRQLSESQIRVTPLSAAELAEAIERPAELAGLCFEQGIVDALIQDIVGEPAGLPLLQFTLMKLWENRKKNRVTWETYRRLGGSHQALERSANEFYEKLLPEDQKRAKYIFLRMVTPGEGMEVTSNRIQRKTLYRTEGDRRNIDPVLEKLVNARLVRLTKGDERDEDQIEVAHEALVRNWDRFIEWLDNERMSVRHRIRLSSAAQRWDSLGRDRGELLRGELLQDASKIDDLNALESEYVIASQRDLEHEEKRWQELFERAERQTRIATARQLAAQSQLTRYSHRSLLLALEALNQTLQESEPRVPEAEEALRKALAKSIGRGLGKYHKGHVTGVRFTPNNRWLITASADKTVRIWDLNDPIPGSASFALRGHEGGIETLAVTPDGCRLFTGSADKTVHYWDLGDFSHAPASHELSRFRHQIRIVKISPDGRWLIVATADNVIFLWDLHDLALPPKNLHGHAWGVRTIAFSSDNRWMLSGSDDQTARLWNLEDDGANSLLLSGFQDAVWGVYFAPNNRWLIVGSLDGTVRLWEREHPDGEPLVLEGSRGSVTAMAISSDSHWLAVGDSDHAVRLWNLDDPSSEPKVLSGHEDWITGLIVSGDNRWLVSGSADKTVRLWELGNLSTPPLVVRGHEDCVRGVRASSDNRLLASCSDDGTVQLVDLDRPWIVPSPQVFDASREPVAISSDNRRLAMASRDDAILLADLSEPAEDFRRLDCNNRPVREIAISPNGQWLAAGTEDPRLFLWDITAEDVPRRDLPGHAWGIQALTWSVNSQLLVTGSDDWSVRIWDLADLGSVPRYLKCQEGVVAVAISPDQRWIIAGDCRGKVYVWDLTDLNAPPCVLDIEHKPIRILRVSPNDRWLIAAAHDIQHTRVWDLRDLSKPPTILPTREKHIASAVFSPDSRRVVTVYSEDPLVRLWDMADLTAAPQVLRGHEWGLRTATISSDNRWLATASDDKSVLLWKLDELSEDPVVLRFDEASVNQLAISADSHWLVTASAHGPTRVWNLRLEELINLAQHAAGRNLTLGEWEQFFGNRVYSKTCSRFPVPCEVIEHELERVHSLASVRDADAAAAYRRVATWATETDDADVNDRITRRGCLDGFADPVMPACERAVELDPHNGDYRIVHGIARALINDTHGAIEEFDNLPDDVRVSRFKQFLSHKTGWLAQLKQGKNPFDQATLRMLFDNTSMSVTDV